MSPFRYGAICRDRLSPATPHRYFFQLFALDIPLSLEAGAGRTALFDALAGHVIGRGQWVGTYSRAK